MVAYVLAYAVVKPNGVAGRCCQAAATSTAARMHSVVNARLNIEYLPADYCLVRAGPPRRALTRFARRPLALPLLMDQIRRRPSYGV